MDTELDKALETIDHALESYEDGGMELDALVAALDLAVQLPAVAEHGVIGPALAKLITALRRIPSTSRRADERESVEALSNDYYESVLEL